MLDTLVIGAGVSGLAYAHARRQVAQAEALQLLEAAPRAGGLVRTLRGGPREAYRYEWGPEALRLEQGELATLLAELGLEARQPPEGARKRFLVHRGALAEVPLRPQRFLLSPLVSIGGKLRMLQEPWRDPARALDGSVAEFVTHRLGAQALAALIDPLVGGIHAGDPAQLSMRACFPRLVRLVEEHGSLIRALRATRGSPAPGVMRPPGGNQSLVDALVGSLAPLLRTGCSVTTLRRENGAWRAVTSAGDLLARRVVVAVPAAAAARLLAEAAPEVAAAAASLRSESLVSLIHAWPRERVGHPLDGFGYLVPSREGLAHMGTLFSSSIDPQAAPPGSVLLRTLAGGARHPGLHEQADAALQARLLREVAPLLALRGEPLFTSLVRHPHTLPRFDLEHPARVARVAAATPAGMTLLGNWLGGIGVNHLVACARAAARA